MDFSRNFFYSTNQPPRISGSGKYVAYVTGNTLVVRNVRTLASRSIINLPSGISLSSIKLVWDTCITDAENCEDRLAVVSEDVILVYVFAWGRDDKKTAEIRIPPGAVNQIARVCWISTRFQSEAVVGNGPEENQVVRLCLFQADGLRVVIISDNGIEHEISAPKESYIEHRDFNSFGIVSRPENKDIMNVLKLSENGQLDVDGFVLQEVLDASIVKWSPSGLFLAGVDSPVNGSKVVVWACDGTLINKYEREDYDPHLGYSTMQWVATNDDEEFLVLGDYDGYVSILSTLSFQVISVISHGSVHQEVNIWQQHEGSSYEPPYYLQLTRLPFRPVRLSKQPTISKLEISNDGSYLAVQTEDMPHIVWIWSIKDVQAIQLLAIFNHLYSITRISWSTTGVLLIVPQNCRSFGTWDSNDQQAPQLHECTETGSIQGAAWIEGENEIPGVLSWTGKDFRIGFYTYTEDTEYPDQGLQHAFTELKVNR